MPNMQQWESVSFLSMDQEECGGFAVSFHTVSTRSSPTLQSVKSHYPVCNAMPLQKWGVLYWQTLPGCSCSCPLTATEAGLNFTNEVCRASPSLPVFKHTPYSDHTQPWVHGCLHVTIPFPPSSSFSCACWSIGQHDPSFGHFPKHSTIHFTQSHKTLPKGSEHSQKSPEISSNIHNYNVFPPH